MTPWQEVVPSLVNYSENRQECMECPWTLRDISDSARICTIVSGGVPPCLGTFIGQGKSKSVLK